MRDVLALQCSHYLLIDCAGGNEVMYDYRLFLPLPVQSRICLLVKLKAPCEAVPDDCVPALLEVEAIADARRMRK